MQALELKDKGWKQNKIAEAVGVSAGAVSQWFKLVREKGAVALRHTPPPGKPARLSQSQKEELVQALLAGPETYGFEGQLWTSQRVRWLIQYKFGITYHRVHVSRLLREELNWSVQKPVEKASQRDEAAIERWRTERWPELKKKAEAESYTVVWIDESAFYLLPALVRTYAPRGVTPVIEAPCSYDHLSVISAITPTGRLCLSVQERSFTTEDVVEFLKKLHRQIGGKILVIWDGASIHQGQFLKNYLSKGAAKWLWLEKLPAYAPDLNPDEGIWNHLKRVELANNCSHCLKELNLKLHDAVRRLRRKPNIIQGCIAQAGLAI